VQEVINLLKSHGAGEVELLSVVKENVSFSLPETLNHRISG